MNGQQRLRRLPVHYSRKPVDWSDVQQTVRRSYLPADLPVLPETAVHDNLDIDPTDHARAGAPQFFLVPAGGRLYLVNTEGYDYVRYAARVEG